MNTAHVILGLAGGGVLGVVWKWLEEMFGEKVGYVFVAAIIAAALVLAANI